MKDTIRILFICHGNICRSPMAEFVMKDLVKKAGLESRFEIESAATSREEIGNPVYPPARRTLAEHGLKCAGKTARQVEKGDYAYWDYLICMERYNIKNLQRITGGDPDGKVSLLMQFAGKNQDIDDPWYTGDFEGVFRQISEGCAALLEQLQ